MQIDLNDKLKAALEERATATGMSVSSYANLLMEDQILRDSQATSRRTQAIDALIEHLKTSTATSGRDGREWREFIHEGHND